MSAGLRIRADEARAIADRVVAALAPACERIEVAGSLRRGAPDVGDIEIVAQSRSHGEPSGLFFDVEAIVYDLGAALDAYVASGVVERLLGKDRYVKLRDRASGVQIDVFMVHPPAQWGVIQLIRTGPADFSHRFVTDIRARGFHVRTGSLHRGGLGCGAVACEVIPTPDERDVFQAVGMQFVAPEARR